MVVLQELGIFGKDLALMRIIDIALQFRETVLSGEGEHIVHHFEALQIEGLGVLAAGERSEHAFKQLYDDGQGIGDENSPQSRSSDDEEFGGLH